jgi:ABC-type glycerol-3-phosphate transport system substrate-binding protein
MGEWTIWVPPVFRPDNGSTAAAILQQRLDAFESSHPGVAIHVRVKAAEGAGGIRDSLAMAAAAAPASLPDVVALNQAELRAAALKGLITRLDSLSGTVRLYPFADTVARLDDGPYGQPFAADAYVLAGYSPDSDSGTTWDDLIDEGGRFFLPLADPQEICLFLEYYAALETPASQPWTDLPELEPLTQMLEWLRNLSDAEVLVGGSLQLDSPEAARARLILSADRALTTFSALAGSNVWEAGAPPTPDGRTFTLATAWSWAMVTQDPSRREVSTELVEWLSDPDFLGEWSHSLGMLPAAPAALLQWPDDQDRDLLGSLLENAAAFPTEEMTATFGPLLRTAAEKVLLEGILPEDAAQELILAVTP